jgi:hypothetical protein
VAFFAIQLLRPTVIFSMRSRLTVASYRPQGSQLSANDPMQLLLESCDGLRQIVVGREKIQ